MQHKFLIQQKVVSRLKQRARRMKRDQSIPHHEALQLVAKAAGFDNWLQVVESAESCRPTEEAFRLGFLIAFDPSELPDIEDEAFPFHWDPYAFDLLKPELLKCCGSQADEEDPEDRPMSETMDPEELLAYFEADWSSMYFLRLKYPQQASSIEVLMKLVTKHSFWLPRFVFEKGRILDTYGLQVPDDAGEISGVPF